MKDTIKNMIVDLVSAVMKNDLDAFKEKYKVVFSMISKFVNDDDIADIARRLFTLLKK